MALAKIVARFNGIAFDPAEHEYSLVDDAADGPEKAGDVIPNTASQLIGNFWPAFDAEAASKRSGRSVRQRWTGNPDCTDAELAAAWARNGEEKAREGTIVHARVQDYILGRPFCHPDAPPLEVGPDCEGLEPAEPKWAKTLDSWFGSAADGWQVLPEARIVARLACGLVAGTVDCIAVNAAGKVVLIDWKSIPPETFDDSRAKAEPFTGLEIRGTKRNRYTAQLYLYAKILKAGYGIHVDECILATVNKGMAIERIGLASDNIGALADVAAL